MRLRPSAEEPEPHRSVKSLGRGYVALAQVSLADPPDGHDIRFDRRRLEVIHSRQAVGGSLRRGTVTGIEAATEETTTYRCEAE